MSYTRHLVDLGLDDLLGEATDFSLNGPEAVGNTTTAE